MSTITIDLKDILTGSPDDIADRVVLSIAEQVRSQSQRELYEEMRKEVVRLVRERVNEKFDEVWNSQMVETDNWGHVRSGGKTLTMAELCLQEIRNYLNSNVDSNGRTDNNSSRSKPRVQWVAEQIASDAISKEIAGEVSKAKDQVKAALQQKLAAIFSETVMQALK